MKGGKKKTISLFDIYLSKKMRTDIFSLMFEITKGW